MNRNGSMYLLARLHFFRSWDELKSDVFHGLLRRDTTNFCRPQKIYNNQFCMDSGYSLEELPTVIADSD